MLNYQRILKIPIRSKLDHIVVPRASSRPSGGRDLQKESFYGTDWNQSTMRMGHLNIYEMLSCSMMMMMMMVKNKG